MKAATARRSLGQLGTRLTTTTPGRWRWEIIPDPIDLVESRIERMVDEQAAALDGCFICPGCKKVFECEPIATSAAPDAAISCYECLGPELQDAYDKFQMPRGWGD